MAAPKTPFPIESSNDIFKVQFSSILNQQGYKITNSISRTLQGIFTLFHSYYTFLSLIDNTIHTYTKHFISINR